MVEEEMRLNSHQLRMLRAVMDEFFRKGDDSKLRQMFEMFDRDGNGKLEPVELKSVMEQIIRERLSEEDSRKLMEEADTNQNGTIEYSEFAEIMLRYRKAQSPN